MKEYFSFFSISICTALLIFACAPGAPSVITATGTPTQPPEISPQEMAEILANINAPEWDIPDRMVRLGILNKPVQRITTTSIKEYSIDDVENFFWFDYTTGKGRTIRASLMYITDHSYFWIELGNSIDQTALVQAAERFEKEIYPAVHDYFGEEWSPGVDNDPHISILHLTGLGMGGAFGDLDEYTIDVMPTSNQREIFYVDLDSIIIGDDQHLSTLAHEFQHMVQWNNVGNESHWLDEGLAQLAERLAGFDVVFTDDAFMQNSCTQLNSWVKPTEDDLHHYGAAYLFTLYLWERLGDDFIRTLARHPAEGLASIDATLDELGYDYEVDEIFSNWVVANYLDDPTIDNGRFGYEHETLNPICPRQKYISLPAHEHRTIPQYAAEYFEIEGKGRIKIEFKGETEAPLIPTEPHNGHSFWWSNRGDNIETNLTRGFDLSSVEKATLQFWVWYNIQKDTDEFACISVSTNGGETWEFPNTKQAASGPLYPCYSGISGGGKEPEWVMEEVDLSPYAGQKILLRFDYLTDTWYNEAGFAVDDITIPQLNYTYDAEIGNDNWEGEGFVRTSNSVPQNWAIQLISIGDEVNINELDISEDGSAFSDVVLGQGIDKTVIVIGAIAPVTNEEAHYKLQITGELTGTSLAKTAEIGVIFADDFSDVCSGWSYFSDSQQAIGYANDAYFLEAKEPQSGVMVQLGQDFSDVVIDVDTKQEAALKDNSWGVLCHYQDENNYYSFNISSNGLYSIDAIANGNYIPLVEWSESSAINLGDGVNNHLSVTCGGGLLSFTVNGQRLAEVNNDTFNHGDIGFMANTYSQGGAMIFFDNLLIRNP